MHATAALQMLDCLAFELSKLRFRGHSLYNGVVKIG